MDRNATNYGTYFYFNEVVDHYLQTAQSLTDILIAPGLFMLKVGITDDDLEDEDLVRMKIYNWLKAECED